MDVKAITIECKGATSLAIEDLVPFQGDLKTLSKANYEKLKKELIRHGFSEPVSAWLDGGRYYILNGHQRVRTLLMMKQEGYFVPPIPVNLVEAKSKKEAKEKVLALTSQYGEITEEGLYEFLETSGIDYSFLDDLRFPEIDLEKWREGFEKENQEMNDGPPEAKHTCPSCGFEF